MESSSKLILSGVPRGSVLGLILYIIYVYDSPSHNTVTVAQFADVIALLSRNTSVFEATTQPYTNLNEMDIWTSSWRIRMNPDKSTLMILPITFKGRLVTKCQILRTLVT